MRVLLAEYDRRWQALVEQVQLRGIDVRNLAATLSPMHREGRKRPTAPVMSQV